MEKLITKNGNIGYRYDEGERPDFDAFISRLAKYGPPKEYWYEGIYEAKSVTDGFDYNSYDKERVKRLGYPADWLRRCGFHPKNMASIPDETIISMCEHLKKFDSDASMIPIVFDTMEIPENVFFDSSSLSYEEISENR